MNRNELITILLDINAYEEERADAAGYLSSFPDITTLEALSKAASNPNETEYVQSKAGESIALIMILTGDFDERYLINISNYARNEIIAVFENN